MLCGRDQDTLRTEDVRETSEAGQTFDRQSRKGRSDRDGMNIFNISVEGRTPGEGGTVDVRESQCVYPLLSAQRREKRCWHACRDTGMLNLIESNNFSEFRSQSGFWPTQPRVRPRRCRCMLLFSFQISPFAPKLAAPARHPRRVSETAAALFQSPV